MARPRRLDHSRHRNLPINPVNPSELINERDTLRCQLHDAREQLARDSATITRVTAEREDWKIRAEEMDGYKADCMALRARVAELEALLSSEKSTRNAIIAKGQAVEQRNAELVAALRDLRVAYEQNASQCVQLNRELKIDTVEWLNGTAIQRDRAEQAERRNAELVEQLKAYGKYAYDTTLEDQNAELVAGIKFIRDECHWGEGPDNGDDRIGMTCDRLLAQAESITPTKHTDTERATELERLLNIATDALESDSEEERAKAWNEVRDAYDRHPLAARKQEVKRE